MSNKTTLIVGASNNPERYSYKAAMSLTSHGNNIINLGIKTGEVAGQPILHGTPILQNIHTITLYVAPTHQEPIYEYLLGLKPKRIIFNPGTENSYFKNRAEAQGIEAIEACTLVMLATNQF